MNPEKFAFEKCIARLGVSHFDIVTRDFKNLQPGVKLLGFCHASRLKVRPRTDQWAMMVELDGEEMWMHLNEDFKNSIEEKQKEIA